MIIFSLALVIATLTLLILSKNPTRLFCTIDKYTIMTKLPEKLEEFKATSKEQDIFIDYLKNKKEISLEKENKFIYKG